MSFSSLAAVAILQESGLTAHDVHLAMIFIGIIALALVVQVIGILVVGSFAARLLHRVDGIANEVHARTTPIIDKANEMLHELSPKITSITHNTEHISFTVRSKVDELGETMSQLNETVQGINGLARNHVAHVDAIVTDALDATEEISATIQEGIRTPVNQVVGIIAGVKAAIDMFISRSPFRRH
jgi:methyl-accepting chemotaxis protein